ncbi:MAG TPA: hypothetical protein VMT11_18715 [Myxococcaceae bacterium]|nr:hypothetical protein [Myxococcaceae bacterium]
MNSRQVVAGAVLALLAGCTRSGSPTHRVELRRISGDTVQIVPSEGQMPYCLVFTHSGKGVVRQLTMSKNNVSVKCGPGEPVLGQAYRIPAEEGPVKIHIFFSDQRLEAASVANQLGDMASPSFNPIDFRMPGNVVVETIDFIPSETNEPIPGALVPRPSPPAATNRPGG